MLELHVRGYKVLDGAEIKLPRGLKDKVVLYGPNAAGKTSIMEVLATIVSGEEGIISERACAHKGFELEVRYAGKTSGIRYVDGLFKASIGDYEASLTTIVEAVKWLQGQLGFEPIRRLGFIDSCAARIGGEIVIDVCRHDYDLLSRLDVEEVDALEDVADKVLGVSEIRYAGNNWYVRVEGRWVLLKDLAYGLRHALAILATALRVDALFIEAFESGMHADLATDMLQYLEGYDDKLIVVETHSGLLVSKAVERWRVYYLEKGRTIELNKPEDLRKTRLFRRELESYTLV